ncbi:MAG: DUF5132 domain-containing protein [Gammaproteobacteria bacterium]
MARNEDLLKGAAIGLGVAVLLPVVVAALMPVIRPMARSALKAGIFAYEKGRETLEGIGETVDDLVAEVEEELVDAREVHGMADDVAERKVGSADS